MRIPNMTGTSTSNGFLQLPSSGFLCLFISDLSLSLSTLIPRRSSWRLKDLPVDIKIEIYLDFTAYELYPPKILALYEVTELNRIEIMRRLFDFRSDKALITFCFCRHKRVQDTRVGAVLFTLSVKHHFAFL